ncbi:type IV toxin-antitoxin system AbiEi family antitoxin domain-containing protein [Salinibacterium sp. TMP30]|uniref:type IV toxin-antitoxin system AbiEi family antitoxin domain-containing protein n=1 Tax=Salinibacterium sp. TMP30 TaxID=3138237 RepID=UPI003138D131
MSTTGLPMRAFSQSEASRAGIDSRQLYRLLDRQQIERISRGLYRRTDLPVADLDLAEIAGRRPDATICLESALARFELIDAIPTRTDIAIARGQRPAKTQAAVEWHVFDRPTFEIGRTLLATGDEGQSIGLYSAERSIVDAFRLRGTVGYETGIEALRNWLTLPASQPAKLFAIAQSLPRAVGPLRTALEILT